jgi:hypothetical protein
VSIPLRKAVLKSGGAMLIGLGMLHLAVTPFVREFIVQHTIPGNVERFTPPMLLNHIVVGILLLPLGILTYYAASFAVAGEKWALFVVRLSACSTILLPIALFLIMGARYFGAVPFVIATVLVSVSSVSIFVTAFWSSKVSAA